MLTNFREFESRCYILLLPYTILTKQYEHLPDYTCFHLPHRIPWFWFLQIFLHCNTFEWTRSRNSCICRFGFTLLKCIIADIIVNNKTLRNWFYHNTTQLTAEKLEVEHPRFENVYVLIARYDTWRLIFNWKVFCMLHR